MVNMTEKELLYLEDAVGHEKNIVSICDFTINNLKDKTLISFIEKESSKHTQILNNLVNKLGDKVNE